MRKRSKLGRRQSKRSFVVNAGVHAKNMRGAPMRGGIRL